MTYEKERVIEL